LFHCAGRNSCTAQLRGAQQDNAVRASRLPGAAIGTVPAEVPGKGGIIMATLTFDHIPATPRRRAVGRPVRAVSAPQAVPLHAPPVATPPRRASPATGALVAAIVGLHAAAIYALSHGTPVAAPAAAPVPITIALAPPKVEPPPPPPPPKPQPKPLPHRTLAAAPSPAVQAPAAARDMAPAPAGADALPIAPAASEAAPAPAPPAEPVTEPRGYAGYLRNPAPDYPLAAQKRGLEGKVVLKVHVLASGQPDNITVAASSGHQILDDAAVRAVQQWAFAPARRGQTAIDGWVQVPLNFKI